MNWKFKESLKGDGLYSEEFWYDLTEGYINPKELLNDDKQIKNLLAAIELVSSFETAFNNIIELYEDK